VNASSSSKKLLSAGLALLIVVAIGTLGFSVIEGDTVFDSLFLTIITISTVGYGLPHELSDKGQVFALVFIIISLGVYAYSISIIISYLVEGNLEKLIRGRKLKGNSKMKNHTIICGFGRIGRQVAEELLAYKKPFLVIDQNSEVILANQNKEIKFLEGDATLDNILMDAGIESAHALISALPLDADNLYVSLSARSLNKEITIISRASNESAEKKLLIAGANHVILPEKVGGAHMAKLVARKDLVGFLNHLSYQGESPTNLEEIDFEDIRDEFHHKTILEIGIRKKSGANIVGFKTPDGEFIINPDPDTLITPKSKLFVLGTPEQIGSLLKSKPNE